MYKLHLEEYGYAPERYIIILNKKIIANGAAKIVEGGFNWMRENNKFVIGYINGQEPNLEAESFSTKPKIGYSIIKITQGKISVDKRKIISIDDHFDIKELDL